MEKRTDFKLSGPMLLMMQVPGPTIFLTYTSRKRVASRCKSKGLPILVESDDLLKSLNRIYKKVRENLKVRHVLDVISAIISEIFEIYV